MLIVTISSVSGIVDDNPSKNLRYKYKSDIIKNANVKVACGKFLIKI